MRMLMLSLLLTVLLVQVKDVFTACTTTLLATESAENAAELKFYRVQTDMWTSDGNSEKVAVQISDVANSYCAGDPGSCGLTNCCTSAFKDSSVGTSSGYPQNSKKDLTLKIYLTLPSGLNTTGSLQCVVSKETLRKIVSDARERIHDDTGYWITWVGEDDFYGIPPAKELNAIIIPIACVVLLGIIITAVILHFWNKRREDTARRQKIVEDRKMSSKNKVQPTYTVDTKEPKVPGGVSGNKSTLVGAGTHKDALYKQNLRQGAKGGSVHSEDSAIKLDSEPRQRQTYAYERKLEPESRATGHDSYGGTDRAQSEVQAYQHLKPLQREPEIEEVQTHEKKKKKKKKRSKSKENMNMTESFENGGYNNTAETSVYGTSVWDYNLK